MCFTDRVRPPWLRRKNREKHPFFFGGKKKKKEGMRGWGGGCFGVSPLQGEGKKKRGGGSVSGCSQDYLRRMGERRGEEKRDNTCCICVIGKKGKKKYAAGGAEILACDSS